MNYLRYELHFLKDYAFTAATLNSLTATKLLV